MIQELSLMEQRYFRFDQNLLVFHGVAVAKSLPLRDVAKLLPLPGIAVTKYTSVLTRIH